MIAKVLRASLLMVPLGLLPAAASPTAPPEQDTANGVAPVKEGAPPAPVASATPRAAVPTVPAPASPPPPVGGGEVKRYCDNIAAVAAEARFAWQTRKLNELQAQVTQRVAELEKKQAELQASLARRDEAMRQAQATLVTIYAKMQPDAAAAQLTLLEDETAAAILSGLSPRQSSAILNEIKPERARDLVSTLTSLPKASDKPDGKKS